MNYFVCLGCILSSPFAAGDATAVNIVMHIDRNVDLRIADEGKNYTQGFGPSLGLVRCEVAAVMGHIVVVNSLAMHLTGGACHMGTWRSPCGQIAAKASVRTPCCVDPLEKVDFCLKLGNLCRQEGQLN